MEGSSSWSSAETKYINNSELTSETLCADIFISMSTLQLLQKKYIHDCGSLLNSEDSHIPKKYQVQIDGTLGPHLTLWHNRSLPTS
jgi:hypothetical protein